MSDKINSPSHYTQGSMETIDIIKAMTENLTGFEGYLVGNIVKYLHRFKYKNGVEDLQKSAWYVQRLVDEHLEQVPTKIYEPCNATVVDDGVKCKWDEIEYVEPGTGITKKLGLG